MSQSWLRLRQLAELFGVRRQTITAWVAAGKFPPPVHLPGGRQVRWDSREVAAFGRRLLAARGEPAERGLLKEAA